MITLRRLAGGSAARSADRGQGGSAPCGAYGAAPRKQISIWTIHFELDLYFESTLDYYNSFGKPKFYHNNLILLSKYSDCLFTYHDRV